MNLLARSGTLAEAILPFPGEVTVLGTPIQAHILRDVALVFLFATIIALCGRVTFYLPDNDFPGSVNPIPITLQTFAVLLTGATLGSRLGLATILLWYFAGMAGTPVFKDGGNGWEYVTNTATGGYLIGFVAATFVIGFLSERGWDRRQVMWSLLIGNLIIYVPGLLWLGAKGFVPWEHVLSKGMYPFIPGDVIKLMMVGIVLPSAWAIVNLRRRQ